ncbi:MAG: hypothetical protein ACXW0T_10235 [Methylobacter sp.]
MPLYLIGSLLSGCASVQSGSNDMKALAVEPAPNAGFIEYPEQQAERADLPFQKVWIKPGFDMNAYRELVVAPVGYPAHAGNGLATRHEFGQLDR